MKNYQTLIGLSKDERNADLKDSFTAATAAVESKTSIQKHVSKVLTAMILSKECGDGQISKHAKEITGEDIRKTLQNVYELTNVFQAIIAGEIAITEEEFDTLDTSKLALLSPFLSDEKLKPHLEAAIEAAKNGTAKEIRELKGPSAEPKAVRELKEKLEKTEERAAKLEKDAADDRAYRVAVGFAATDIKIDEPLVNSRQFKDRLHADMVRAAETENETDLETMVQLFGKAFNAACQLFGADPHEFLAEMASDTAKAATGQVVEVLAIPA